MECEQWSVRLDGDDLSLAESHVDRHAGDATIGCLIGATQRQPGPGERRRPIEAERRDASYKGGSANPLNCAEHAICFAMDQLLHP